MKTSRGRELLTDNQRTELIQTLKTTGFQAGWSYTHFKRISHIVIQYIAQQINVPAVAIHSYGQGENTYGIT